MNRNNSLFLALALLSSGTGADDTQAQPTPTLALSGYKLVWSDEFSKEPNGLPDPKKWTYEIGFIRNHEPEYYTARPENARIENGMLVIEGRKEEYTPDGATAPVAHYTSASIQTRTKANWTYGLIEVRAKLPAGKGVWPAIWTLGADEGKPGSEWPRCGEIDIMELIGKEPGIIHGTVHYFVDGKHVQRHSEMPIDNTDTDFHIYAAEWTPTRINFFIDDIKYFSFHISKADNDGQNPFHKPQFLLFNLALGGDWGGPIDDTILPQRMSVAYVRIFQKPKPSP